jgi:putative phosphoesterase
MRIGVIADTHGAIVPAVHEALAGVSVILHAGDIGGEAVIAELELIARVVAVRGNTDRDLAPPRFPDIRRLTLDGVDLFLCHETTRALGLVPPPAVIVHGHSHQPRNERVGETLWFNPGTASRPRFGHRLYSVGILHLEQGAVTGDIISLEVETGGGAGC